MTHEIKDRVQDTTATTGTGPLTLANAAPAGWQTFGAAHTVGATFEYFVGNGNEWEVGLGTLIDATHMARSPTASSNGGALVNFSAGSKIVFENVSAETIARMAIVRDIPFAAAVPLDRRGQSFMPQTPVTGALAFTPAAGAVRGALAYVRLVANGVNVPTFTGFLEHLSSHGYDNRNGIVNPVTFFHDGDDAWYSVAQAVNAQPVAAAATAVTLTGPATGVVNTTSSAFTVGTNGTRAGAVVVTPTPVAGVTFAPTSVTLPAGTSTATFTATSSTTGAKTIAVTNNSGTLTNPASITHTVAAAATAPAQMAAPTAAQTGATTADVTLVVPSNGGSAITGFTVVSSPAGGVDTDAGTTELVHNITGLTTGQAYTFTATATNGVGPSPASPASNSVTPVAPANGTLLTLTSLTNGLTMTSPGEYSGGGAAFGAGAGTAAAGALKIPANQSGYVSIDIPASPAPVNCLVTLDDTVSYAAADALFALWVYVPNGSIMWSCNSGGGSGAYSYKTGAGVRYRLYRNGTTGAVTLDESVDSGATWTTVYTLSFTWTNALYPGFQGAAFHQPRGQGLA